MQAYQLLNYPTTTKLTLVQTAKPQPEPHQVVVKVAATGVNPVDLMISRGELKRLIPYQLPQTMGNELAGTIVTLGSEVRGFAVGEEIYARPNVNNIGTFAEYAAIDAADIAHKPANLSMTEAASLPLVTLTAVQAFTEKSTIGPGSTVFIQGGTGGLGSIAIQVAKFLGATVATTVSTPNVDIAKKLGADIVIDYKTETYEDIISGYDVALDTLGGAETIRAMSVLRPGGTLISVSGAPDKSFAAQLGKPLLGPVMQILCRKERAAARKLGITYSFLFMHADGQSLEDFRSVIEAGHITPLIGHTFPFQQLPEALALVESGKSKPGKVVVSVKTT